MKQEMARSYAQLEKTCRSLERHYREPQDIEFTIEQGRFYLLQTRNAKMNAAAMIKTSVDMVRERLIGRNRALQRLQVEQMEQLLHRTIDNTAVKNFSRFTSGIAGLAGRRSWHRHLQCGACSQGRGERSPGNTDQRGDKARRCACVLCICRNPDK